MCLAVRRTDQLEELWLCPVGHAGLEFVLGVVRRCTRLHTLRVEVRDVPTLYVGRTRLSAEDYDTSGYAPPAAEAGGEAEEEEEGEDGKDEKEEANKLQEIFRENDYDSEEEGLDATSVSASESFLRKLDELVSEVRKKENLVYVECVGDAVPPCVQADLAQVVEEHRALRDKRLRVREDQGAQIAYAALGAQMQELCQGLDGDVDVAAIAEAIAEAATSGEEGPSTRLGTRSVVSRRLLAVLGEALFECQRLKSKEDEAVSTPEGEKAFIAMYLRKHGRDLQYAADGDGEGSTSLRGRLRR